jgi:hypothetical protein
MAGASSVAHLVSLGRLTGGGKPPGAAVCYESQPCADVAEAPAGAVIEGEAEAGGDASAVAAVPTVVSVIATGPAGNAAELQYAAAVDAPGKAAALVDLRALGIIPR